jgi:hypothetical protein
MKIKRSVVPVLAVAGVGVGIGLALLLALVVGVGTAQAAVCTDGVCCDADPAGGPSTLCDGPVSCWGPSVEAELGCERVVLRMNDPASCEACLGEVTATAAQFQGEDGDPCGYSWQCVETGAKQHPAAIWLADVCEPNDGFSDDGQMTLDTNTTGPLEVGASFDGPWNEVEVNGPPWVATEEVLASFAEMVGIEDWHDLWVRSGEGYPQYLGNMILEREGRMDLLCAQ